MQHRVLAVAAGVLTLTAVCPSAPARAELMTDLLTPVAVYNHSGYKSTYVPEKVIDGIVGQNLNMWVSIDDTFPGGTWTVAWQPITGHIVLDMGKAVEMEYCQIWAREYIGGNPPTLKYGPKDVKFFYFEDDNPANVQGTIDDVEGDPNIVEAWSGTLLPLPNTVNWNDGNNADSERVHFTSRFTRRYVGMRIDSSYAATENFQIAELAFGVPEPSMIVLVVPGLVGGLFLWRRRN